MRVCGAGVTGNAMPGCRLFSGITVRRRLTEPCLAAGFAARQCQRVGSEWRPRTQGYMSRLQGSQARSLHELRADSTFVRAIATFLLLSRQLGSPGP